MDRQKIDKLLEQIADACRPMESVRLMEVCGTHTVAMFRSGLKGMLPGGLRLVSGPGCPVCVTSQGYIEAACELAGRADVTICTYGDMVRVPGRGGSLAERRAAGASLAVVYSIRDALSIARKNPARKIVFLAVGFETTAPATAVALIEAHSAGLGNFFVLHAHKRIIPAMEALLRAGEAPIDGFLCPGHVSVVIGSGAYAPIAERFARPCVVAGFEPAGMLEAILLLCRQVAAGESRVQNAYGLAVSEVGNAAARGAIERVFKPAPAVWRAMGELPDSGLNLREDFKQFDATEQLDVTIGPDFRPPGCRCGEVIQALAEPADCPLFGGDCTPLQPVGPCMVSSEGTCAAWYKYGRKNR